MVDEVINPNISEEALRATYGGYLGSNPYYLMVILRSEGEGEEIPVAQIDLDEPGWATTYARYMRDPGQWYLVRKVDNAIVATMLVWPGEQPYYVARHVGFAGTTNAETTNYGIGKKRNDGHVDRIWVMANGCITLGDDVEPISIDLLKQGLL